MLSIQGEAASTVENRCLKDGGQCPESGFGYKTVSWIYPLLSMLSRRSRTYTSGPSALLFKSGEGRLALFEAQDKGRSVGKPSMVELPHR